MSLSKQMMLFITGMLVILLLGTFLLNLNNTRSFLEAQLQSHAQDTATSLGLSLSSVANPEDPSSMETMINAVFDRGYYSHITMRDMDGQLIYEKSNSHDIDGIPNWFINLISIEAPNAEALVQSGWIPLGHLTVQSHPGYAYIELWKTAITLLLWFTLAAAIAIGFAAYALRVMLTPLKKMEKQAEAIVRKEYLLQEALPGTIEFKRVVSAMNAMVYKMKKVFDRDAQHAEKLQKLAYQDSVTGLSNRRHFEMNIDALLDTQAEASPGTICLIRIHHLKEFNDQFGYMSGDNLVKALADKMMNNFNFDNSFYARLNGSELLTIMPTISGRKLSKPVSEICEAMPKVLSHLKASESQVSISIAYLDYTPGNNRSELLAQLDFATKEASQLGKNQYFYYQPEKLNAEEDTRWKDMLNVAIKEKRFILFQQAAYDENRKIHSREALLRLKDENNTIHSASFFIPAIRKLNKMDEIDKLAVSLAVTYLSKHTLFHGERLAINLGQSIIRDQTFQNWLFEQLETVNTDQIAIEIPEAIINANRNEVRPLIERIKSMGIQFGLDHFGNRFTNMNYIQELRPDYIKLDTSFSKAIEQDEQTHYYISSLCDMSQSLDIQIIAMSIENEAQIQAFKELGIHHFQGYYFGAPKSL
ncbi:EAL domain-containing protein [Hydrogenovibrio sp. 3SP14C1]|uniref:bifunctional diguanylate cyclase/phosphodiesterase n=1 Tax=Hydrogenovibrio sp. 3SP14C1 TaxID=3038774 RepID=UPI002416E4E9|nr:EAL domain-containing protein [Hydrogenovibrio sp. 3SP14C1]MDG4813219.1 EAL domain-containing protein [Hydrogenovibrio sp. 3SP14C1]